LWVASIFAAVGITVPTTLHGFAIDGVNLLDATIYGIGRGAGNCNLELLLNFLKNPKFDVRPVYKVIQEQFVPCGTKSSGVPTISTASAGT
jgi:hypothetical protein